MYRYIQQPSTQQGRPYLSRVLSPVTTTMSTTATTATTTPPTQAASNRAASQISESEFSLSHLLSPTVTKYERYPRYNKIRRLYPSTLICLYPSCGTCYCFGLGPNVPAKPCSTPWMYNVHFISFLLLSRS
jgi:hypothetical protein